MRIFSVKTLALVALVGGLTACSKNNLVNEVAGITPEVQAKISALGFRASDAYAVEDGYIVEGDILLTDADLNRNSLQANYLVIGQAEQYRTTNLVTGLPRVITVSISSQLPTSYVAALDEALGRYNAENLQITFQRVASGANIDIVRGNGSYLASAGFPTSTGNPHGQIKVNSRSIGNQPQSTVATILAHEIGHCIGFRHTDYMDRSYSCGGSPTNEGASTVGAIHIAGTPTGPDARSFMLACIGSGQDRPFNSNDKTALSTLY